MISNPAVLWSSSDHDVLVVDIPTSICLAQFPIGAHIEKPVSLTSCLPQSKPWNSTEPKSAKARQNIIARTDPLELERSSVYAEFVRSKLPEAVAGLADKKWCLPRSITSTLASRLIESEVEQATNHTKATKDGRQAINLHESVECNGSYSVNEIDDFFMYNNSRETMQLIHAKSQISYMIPSGSSLWQGSIDPKTASSWSRVITNQLPSTESAWSGQFNLVVLDPPWDNKSVKRKRNYETAYAAETDPLETLTTMLLPHIALDATVACWVTNNAKTRDQALRAFSNWDIELVEEWIWLKVTEDGQPVYDLDGLWRKPYEILLIGRKIPVGKDDQREAAKPRLKLLVAVSDLHSRKPCLRDLLTPLLPVDCRGLEIFARHLVAGWSSWGNEVLKFNSSEHMTRGI